MRQLYKLYYKYLELFPKKDKFALGAKCENYIITVLELLLSASSANKEEKATIVKRTSIKFDTLKAMLRITRELDIIDAKKYINLQKQLFEIGRQLGGWQKSLM